MRPHGRARVSARSPQAFGICDRCGFLYNHSSLRWQHDWAGASLINKRILVCRTCEDKPQDQLRAFVVPADPVPIMNPRTQDYVNASVDFRTTQGNSVNSATGLPVVGGDIRESNVDLYPGGLVTQENGAGDILTEDLVSRIAQEGQDAASQLMSRVTQQTGAPNGSLNQLPGTNPDAPGNSDPGLPYENEVVPKTGPV